MDSVPCLKAWSDHLGGINYPLLSDFYPHGKIAEKYGVLRAEGYSERAIFIIDKNGILRYYDIHDIDEQPDNEELFNVLGRLEPASFLHAASQAASRPESSAVSPAPEALVTLYCTPWCPDCRRARAYLEASGIPFVEVDITRNRAAAQRVRGWANGNETTPTFDIKGQIVVNFSREKVDQALKNAGILEK